MKFSIKVTADLVTFTEKILNRKLQFLCSGLTPDIFAVNALTFYAFFAVNLNFFPGIF